jgi:hypothetical protein
MSSEYEYYDPIPVTVLPDVYDIFPFIYVPIYR